MKKTRILFLAMLLTMAILVGCNTNNNKPEDDQIDTEQTSDNDTNKVELNNHEENKDKETEDEEKANQQNWLTETEAWELVEQWLEEHPEMATPYEPTTIAEIAEEMYVYNDEEYYYFELNGTDWLDILLHPETEEMLLVVTEYADEPVEPTIEPIMDYYNRYY